MRKCYSTFALILCLIKVYSVPLKIDSHIKVDQFGYTNKAQKIAVVSNPQIGYNSSSPFSPGTGTNNYQVRRWSDDVVVFSGTLVAWNGGSTHAQSGDQVWWFDFSSLTTTGTYYVFDVSNSSASYQFDINNAVYDNVLSAAVRMFYYQRCGIARTAANAGAGWADGVCHKHASNQDANCMLYSSPSDITTSKDLSGGWHDAGDYTKYVNYAFGDATNLLLAYSESPHVWSDNYNIPESGNGIPDILDEIKWELDWLLKMQQQDGSVLSMVGNPCTGGSGSTSPPSSDINQRVYGPATTSATLSSASLFALAAIQFNSVGMTTYANILKSAAINAWNWASNNPNVLWYNNSNGNCYIPSGEQEAGTYGILCRQLGAATFLFQLTGNSAYKTFFELNYTQTHFIQWGYAYIFETTIQDILLYYSSLPNATPSVANTIKTTYLNSIKTGNTDCLPAYLSMSDAYRAYLSNNNYTWGSNNSKGSQGNMFMSMNVMGLDTGNANNYSNAASGFIHYIHGVNPNAFTYLTNMSSYNSENSLTSIFHTWFCDGSSLWDKVGVSTYGPAPGFLSGGPMNGYSVDGCCPNGCGSAGNNALCNTTLLTPPLGQPIQKTYKDWNTAWPQDSWSLTEPDIGYQAAYVRLLSKFAGSVCTATISPSGSTSFCQGGSVVLSASSGSSYKWFKGTTLVGTSSVYTATNSGVYTVQVTNLAGCQATSDTTFVTANPLPVISQYININSTGWQTLSSTTVCQNSSVYFGPWPNVSSGWTWKGPNGFTSSARNPLIKPFLSGNAGIYTATYTDSNGCKASADFTISVSVPTAIITASATTFCQGGSALLSASAGTAYQWFNGTTQIGSTSSYTASSGGSYMVIVTNTNGCKDTSAVTIISVTPLPTVSIVSPMNNATVNSDTVTIKTNTSSNVIGVTFYEGSTYLGMDATSPFSYTVPNLANGSYSFSAVAQSANCTNTASVNVIVARVVTGLANLSFSQEGYYCFPNPYVDSFQIQALGAFTYIICDMTGNELQYGNGENVVSAGENLKAGMYLVKIQNQNGSKVLKVTKNL